MQSLKKIHAWAQMKVPLFARVLFSQKLREVSRKKTTLQNKGITLSLNDVGKSYPSLDFLTWQICLLTLFAKIKFLRKFPNLQFVVLRYTT